MEALLVLEDGTVFKGTHIGAERDVISEIVFNTSMVGYLEVLTDASYVGQTVCMTYPLIGNYGICKEDMESQRLWADGIIVRELSRIPSNFRTEMTIQEFLEANNVPGIAGIDTRALTRHLREKGTMNGMITTNTDINIEEVLPKLKEYKVGNKVKEVTCKEKYSLKPSTSLEENGPIAGMARFDKEAYEKGVREPKPSMVRELNGTGLKVAIWDLGVKNYIAESLAMRGCEVTVYPAQTRAEELLADKPDGILISNGPGNPKDCTDLIAETKKLYEADCAIMAIGLGHQLMALATGADTYKMKHGHRGANYPVKDLVTGRVYISTQNHGYAVNADSLNEKVAVPAYSNVNDGTNEGLAYVGKNILTAQHYPDACLKAQDPGSLFDRFIKMMKEGR